MNKQNKAYLDKFKLDNPHVKKIESIVKFYESLLGDDLSIFISETYNVTEKRREILSLYLYNSSYLCEAENIKTNIELDIACIKNRISILDLQSTNLPLEMENEIWLNDNFLICVRGRLSGSTVFEMKASGDNCIELLRIYRSILFPNLMDRKIKDE